MTSRTQFRDYSRIKDRYFLKDDSSEEEYIDNSNCDNDDHHDSEGGGDKIDVIDNATRLKLAYDRQSIARLPALASKFYEDTFPSFGIYGDEIRQLLIGTRDKGSNLSTLLGSESTILRHIYSFLAHEWANYVTRTLPASCIGRFYGNNIGRYSGNRDYDICDELSTKFKNGDQEWVAFSSCGHIEFPDPADRNINMMPFIFGDKNSLPEEFQCYHGCIESCPYTKEEIGKVGYLTVHESYVEPSSAQRREGLHIETPGNFVKGDGSCFTPSREHHWGAGMFYDVDVFEGGIFMASNVADSCEIYDALVNKNAAAKGIVDRHGSCEHLRGILGPATRIEANELIWMTDRTPHEAIPQKIPGYRQFFRIVTPKVSHWFAAHSTPNPLVDLPDDVEVVHENKFQ